MLSKDNLDQLDLSQFQSVYFDFTKLIYIKNFEKDSALNSLRKIEAMIQKKQVPVFALIRDDLLCNEYLYVTSKAVIISALESKICAEERFAEPNTPFPVSILSKPGSGKLEIDDRFEFSINEGFKIRKVQNKTSRIDDTSSSPNFPTSTFNMERKKVNDQGNISEAIVFVEDSDRDSENEMEADADF